MPATNEALEHAWNIDVTAAPSRNGGAAGGHLWPVQYYLGQLGPGDIAPAAGFEQARARGAVVSR